MIVKFKEIADYVAGQSPESKYYSNTEGIPFLQGNRTFGLFYPTIDTYTKKITVFKINVDFLLNELSITESFGKIVLPNQN